MLDYPSCNGYDDELMPEWAKNGCIRCGNRISWNNKDGYCRKCRATKSGQEKRLPACELCGETVEYRNT